MRPPLALAAVPAVSLLVLMPAPARAQGNGPCIHQGQQVQCPPGLPPGSQSVSFVPGGTNWRNSATGAIVFVPGTTFPPFMPTPTAPPGPTTQPGPGTQPTSPSPGLPLTTEGFLTLASPAAPPSTRATGDATRELLVSLAGVALDAARKDFEEARRASERVSSEIAAEGRFFSRRFYEVVRITPEMRYDSSNPNYDLIGSAPADPAATERYRAARSAVDRASSKVLDAQEAYQKALRAAEGPPASTLDTERTGPLVQESDVEKAPTFEPFKDQGAVDEVM